MYYYLYETRNKINNKIYDGVHQTENLDDGYIGSGKLLRRAIEKYGIDNFEKSILEFFDTREEMFAREAEVVNEEFVRRDDTYNLTPGGKGGFWFVNENKLGESFAVKNYDANFQAKAGEMRRKYLVGVEYDSDARQKGHQMVVEKRLGYLNPHHQQMGVAAAQSEESKTRRKHTMAVNGHQRGEKNSQSGTKWITDGVSSKKVDRDEPLPDGWSFGRSMNRALRR